MIHLSFLALIAPVLALPQLAERQATAAPTTTVADSAPVSSAATAVSTTASATVTVLTTTRSIIAQTLVPTTPAAIAPVQVKQFNAQSTVAGTGTLPVPTTFIKRSGNRLFNGNTVYRIAGPNVYWLGLDESQGIAYPDRARVREALAAAVAMGANTVRVQTFGISTGNSLSFEPSLGVFNAKAFDQIAYGVFAAKRYGLRVIIPLTDQYQYYLGGKCDFVRFVNADQSNYCNSFYTNANALAAFKTYIKQLLTTTNTYTGTTLANEPAVLAWETGNEFGAYQLKQGVPPLPFTNQIAQYIKSLAPNQLVIDGTDGIRQQNGQGIPGLQSQYVDIVSSHYYPPDANLANAEFALSKNANKVFLAGEYDWTSSALGPFLTRMEKNPGSGDMLWSLWGHADAATTCQTYSVHNDGYSLYYPAGNPASQQANILAVVQHWYRQTGRTAPSSLVGVACPQPVF